MTGVAVSARIKLGRVEMQRLVFLLLFLLLAHEAPIVVAAQVQGCNRRCGPLVVPYPFGFSGSCPIILSCSNVDGNSTAALILQGNAATDYSYTVVDGSFNSTTSTFVVSFPPSCNRTVSDARRWLSGANYAVSSRTGLFLRGCRNVTTATNSNCSAPVTANCGAETASSLTCIASLPAVPTAPERGVGLFVQWDRVEELRCDNLLTSVYGDMREGVFSLELAMAEMGWWVNGNCSNGGYDPAGLCAANATCLDVQTPAGLWGHQCRCLVEGMAGAAGDGCYARYIQPAGSSLQEHMTVTNHLIYQLA